MTDKYTRAAATLDLDQARLELAAAWRQLDRVIEALDRQQQALDRQSEALDRLLQAQNLLNHTLQRQWSCTVPHCPHRGQIEPSVH